VQQDLNSVLLNNSGIALCLFLHFEICQEQNSDTSRCIFFCIKLAGSIGSCFWFVKYIWWVKCITINFKKYRTCLFGSNDDTHTKSYGKPFTTVLFLYVYIAFICFYSKQYLLKEWPVYEMFDLKYITFQTPSLSYAPNYFIF
jgi:hypothetical protein